MSRKKGKRDRSGKLLRPTTRVGRKAKAAAPDTGNLRVQARRVRFAIFQGGRADDEIHDPLGRAWAAGLLDGAGLDPVALRDAGREFGTCYWYCYAGFLPRTAQLDRPTRSTGQAASGVTARERRFQRLDAALGPDLGAPVRRAVYSLCVDHWGQDDQPTWLERCVNSRIALLGRTADGDPPGDGDWKLLRLAVEGLEALVRGRDRSAA